jgi:hypothetical protein
MRAAKFGIVALVLAALCGPARPLAEETRSKATDWGAVQRQDKASPGAAKPALPQETARKVALVVGNSGYRSLPPLANPRRDADLIAGRLAGTGFKIIGGNDLDRAAMQAAIGAFIGEVKAASGDVTALIFYAGHGMQDMGDNYLLPVDANIPARQALAKQAFSATRLLREVDAAGAALNILVLDACRDNPLAKEGDFASIAGGLATMDAPRGAYIAYSAAAGRTAFDGDGDNSPFSAALADYLLLPGQTIGQIMTLVGRRVQSETAGAQVPWTTSSLTRDFVPSGVRVDKAKAIGLRTFDDYASYVVTYRAFDGVTLACGASLIYDWQSDMYGRILAMDEIRPYLSADHFMTFHTFTKYNVPYFCELFCRAEKAAYCRDVEVLKAIRDRLKLISARPGGGGDSELTRLKLPVLTIPDEEAAGAGQR